MTATITVHNFNVSITEIIHELQDQAHHHLLEPIITTVYETINEWDTKANTITHFTKHLPHHQERQWAMTDELIAFRQSNRQNDKTEQDGIRLRQENSSQTRH